MRLGKGLRQCCMKAGYDSTMTAQSRVYGGYDTYDTSTRARERKKKKQ